MIRLVQRKLIIPRGDTGSFSIPSIAVDISQADIAVFTIFDCRTHTKLYQKYIPATGAVLTFEFTHNDTVNLTPGRYVWDVKFYKNPQYADEELVGGEEVDSYYAGFSLPECEIRETGDDLLVSPDAAVGKLAPAQLDIITNALADVAEAVAETESNVAHYPYVGEDRHWYVWDAASGAFVDTGVSATGDGIATGGTQGQFLKKRSNSDFDTEWGNETDPTVPSWAKEPTKPTYTASEVGALPANTYIPQKTSDLTNDSNYVSDANYIHTDNNYTIEEKEKLGGIAAGAEVNVNADWNANSGDAQILNKPTKVSEFTNDAGYLVAADISGKQDVLTFDSTPTALSGNPVTSAGIKSYVDTAISTLNTMRLHICVAGEYDTETGMPTIQNPDTQTLYLVPGGSGNNLYVEWAYVNNAWEKFGQADLDLSGYALKTDTILNTTLSMGRKAGTTVGTNSVALGYNVEASGNYTFAEGYETIASGIVSHAMGIGTTASGMGSTAEGCESQASGAYSHVEGYKTMANYAAHAEGGKTKAIGQNSHAEGNGSIALTYNSHAEGSDAKALGNVAHAEGTYSVALGHYSHTESNHTLAVGRNSHAENHGETIAIKVTGDANATTYSYTTTSSHLAVGDYIAYDQYCKRITAVDTANLQFTVEATLVDALNAVDLYVYKSGAFGEDSHTEGYSTIALANYQHAQGKFNVRDTNGLYADIVGNGTANDARSNAYALTWTGDGKYAGDIYVHSNNDSSGGVKLATVNSIAIQTTQPSTSDTKIWIDSDADSAIQVPTVSELNSAITTAISDTIAIQPTAPVNVNNKIWIDDDVSGTVQVPTSAEMNSALAGKVSDVQVNEVSVVNNGVANIPVASTSDFGVVKLDLIVNSGLKISNDCLRIDCAGSYNIKIGSGSYTPIVPARQHESVFYGLAKAAGDSTQSASSNAVGTYTDSAKAAIQAMLGVGMTRTLVSGSTPTITAASNTMYICGEVSTLSITPPASGVFSVIFESGSTATVLTLDNSIKCPVWFDPTDLETDMIYELNCNEGLLSVGMWEAT